MDISSYFNNIFIKNIDVWGFVMTYMPLYTSLYDRMSSLHNHEKKILDTIKYVTVHYLFENPITPIPIEELVKDLKSMNPYFSSSR
jgi:hypothetical protein